VAHGPCGFLPLILVHGYVEDPVQADFDAPMGAGHVTEALGTQWRAEQVVGGVPTHSPFREGECRLMKTLRISTI
jgi:hypothetical protein